MAAADPTDPMETPIVVVAICGSLRRGSYTRQALTIALEGAGEVGARTTDRSPGLPARLLRAKDEDECRRCTSVARRGGARQGIILGTPEYHGGFSGVLKNALDLMGPAEIQGKMLGLVGVSGGTMGATNALIGLRTVVLAACLGPPGNKPPSPRPTAPSARKGIRTIRSWRGDLRMSAGESPVMPICIHRERHKNSSEPGRKTALPAVGA